MFLRYVLSSTVFESEEHEKAWFIRVTINACRDLLRQLTRRPIVPLDALAQLPADTSEDNRSVLEAVLSPARKIQGCGLPSLLRGLHRPGDRQNAGQENQHRVYPSDPGKATAQAAAGGERHMNERIQSAFDQVRAEPELKERTLAALAKKTGGFSRRSAAFVPWRRPLPLWPWWCCARAAPGGTSLRYPPSALTAAPLWSWVSTALTGWCPSRDMTKRAALWRMNWIWTICPIPRALETILDSEAISVSLAQGEQMSISVVASSDEKSQALFSGVQACTGQEENIHCASGDPQLLHQAHECGLSLGKYQAYLTLSELDPSITAEQVQNCSMAAQIRDWIWQLSRRWKHTRSGAAGRTGRPRARTACGPSLGRLSKKHFPPAPRKKAPKGRVPDFAGGHGLSMPPI